MYKFMPMLLIVSAGTSCGLKNQMAPSAVQTSEIALTTGEAFDSLRLRTTNQRCMSFTAEVLHFEAPSSNEVPKEMKRFGELGQIEGVPYLA